MGWWDDFKAADFSPDTPSQAENIAAAKEKNKSASSSKLPSSSLLQRPDFSSSNSNVATIENAPLPVWENQSKPQSSLPSELKSVSFGEYATMEEAPVPIFEQMDPVTPSLLALQRPKIATTIPFASSQEGNLDLTFAESTNTMVKSPKKVKIDPKDRLPEDKSLTDWHKEFKEDDNPEANPIQKLGEFFSNFSSAVKARATIAPVDALLDTVGVIAMLSNPFVGVAANLASEPAQRAVDGRSKNGGFVGDFTQNIKESPGTLLSAVPGYQAVGAFTQLALDVESGKKPPEAMASFGAGLATPIISQMVPDMISGNVYLNLIPKVIMTKYAVNEVAKALAPSFQPKLSVDPRAVAATTTGIESASIQSENLFTLPANSADPAMSTDTPMVIQAKKAIDKIFKTPVIASVSTPTTTTTPTVWKSAKGTPIKSLLSQTTVQGTTPSTIPPVNLGNQNTIPVIVGTNTSTYSYSPVTEGFGIDSPVTTLALSSYGGNKEEEEEEDLLFKNPFATKPIRQLNAATGGATSRSTTFDPKFKEINSLGFATGKTLAGSYNPNDQFSTRQRTSGNRFEDDTVSYLARRTT